MALFYSIVFDIFGPRNYRTAFALCLWGFGVATAIGGLSSAYSFSSTAIPPGTPDATAGAIAGQWFYAMAGNQPYPSPPLPRLKSLSDPLYLYATFLVPYYIIFWTLRHETLIYNPLFYPCFC